MSKSVLENCLFEEIDQLKQELKEANESITWWKNRFNAVERDYVHYKNLVTRAIHLIQLIQMDNELTWKNLNDILNVLLEKSENK